MLTDAFSGGTTESFPGGSQQTIYASQILESGGKFDPKSKVTAVTAKMIGLREWYGKAPYQATHSVDNHRVTYVLDMNDAVEQNVILYEGINYIVKLFHYIQQGPLDASGFSVSHDCGVKISFSHPVERNEAVSLALRVSDLISLFTCFDAQVTELALEYIGNRETVLCHAPFIVGEMPSPYQLAMIPIRFDAIADRTSYVLGNWLNDSDRLAEAENMLCSLMINSWKLPLNLKFIGAAQLLESLSKYGANTQALEPSLYTKYVSAALENIEDPEVMKWARQKLGGNNKGQTRLLKELLNRNHPVIDWLLPTPN